MSQTPLLSGFAVKRVVVPHHSLRLMTSKEHLFIDRSPQSLITFVLLSKMDNMLRRGLYFG
jgi:hypothetical protein